MAGIIHSSGQVFCIIRFFHSFRRSALVCPRAVLLFPRLLFFYTGGGGGFMELYLFSSCNHITNCGTLWNPLKLNENYKLIAVILSQPRWTLVLSWNNGQVGFHNCRRGVGQGGKSSTNHLFRGVVLMIVSSSKARAPWKRVSKPIRHCETGHVSL